MQYLVQHKEYILYGSIILLFIIVIFLYLRTRDIYTSLDSVKHVSFKEPLANVFETPIVFETMPNPFDQEVQFNPEPELFTNQDIEISEEPEESEEALNDMVEQELEQLKEEVSEEIGETS